MKLTTEEQKAILAGRHPEIVREGTKSPFSKGEVIGLKFHRTRNGPVPQVSLTILKVKRGKKGEFMPEYSIRDDRDRFLRRGGGTTSSPADSIDPEACLIDAESQAQFSKEGTVKTRLAGYEQRQREGVTRLELKLNEARRLNKPGRVRNLETRIGRKIRPLVGE